MFAFIEHAISALIGRVGQQRLHSVIGRFDALKSELRQAADHIAHEMASNDVKKAALDARNAVLDKEHTIATSLHDKIHALIS